VNAGRLSEHWVINRSLISSHNSVARQPEVFKKLHAATVYISVLAVTAHEASLNLQGSRVKNKNV